MIHGLFIALVIAATVTVVAFIGATAAVAAREALVRHVARAADQRLVEERAAQWRGENLIADTDRSVTR